MKKFSGPILPCFLCFLSVAAAARGQSAPAQTGSPLYTGFQMPDVNGTLHYAVNAGERLTLGQYSPTVGDYSAATISGSLGFITPSITKPTTVDYTGGYIASTGGVPSSFFHDFGITQQINTKNWKIEGSDQVRYLPETETNGVAGVLGVGTTTGTTAAQGALIPYAARIFNGVEGDITRKLTGQDALNVSGAFTIDRFIGNNDGIQTNIYAINGGFIRRVNPLTSFAIIYTFSNFTYVGVDGAFESQGVHGLYKRQLTRQFSFSVAAGPEYIDSSSLTGQPAKLSYTADINGTYTGSASSGFTASAAYQRSTTGGAGITYGALNDTFSGTASRRITRSLGATALVSYSRSSGLQLISTTQVNSQSLIGNIQANRAFTRTLSAFVSYGAQQQAIQGYVNAGLNPLNGLRQILGFGITYSPSPVHLGGR